MTSRSEGGLIASVVGVVLLIGFITLVLGGLIFGLPYYRVYSRKMDGEAELAHAEFSKRVAVETAKAKRDAAEMEAEAEITRAKGVAKANEIIGQSLSNNEAYLRYLWITGMDNGGSKTVVYIPTEAGMPILESSRLEAAKESK